jgi:hypothetical protein
VKNLINRCKDLEGVSKGMQESLNKVDKQNEEATLKISTLTDQIHESATREDFLLKEKEELEHNCKRLESLMLKHNDSSTDNMECKYLRKAIASESTLSSQLKAENEELNRKVEYLSKASRS